MREIDNLEHLASFIFNSIDELELTKEERDDLVVLGRVIRRKKENPDKPSEYVVKRYTFRTKEELLNVAEEIKSLCDLFNARFYLCPTVKSVKDIAQDMLEELPKLFRNNAHYAAKRLYDSCADMNSGVKNLRSWVFDIDYSDKDEQCHVVKTLKKVMEENNIKFEDVFRYSVETINGVHLIMKPHDTRYMDKKVEDDTKMSDLLDVKKNGLTLGYFKIK